VSSTPSIAAAASTNDRAATGAATEAIRRAAHDAGFDAVGIARADAASRAGPRLDDWLDRGRHGDMDWMESRRAPRRAVPALWPEARSIVMLGLNYGPDHDPLASLGARSRGNISVYARGGDYHDLIKSKLRLVAHEVRRAAGGEAKIFVDTAPLMEKPNAQGAGLGWQGKHTNLVSRQFGSWLFLGAVLTDAELVADAPETDHCGACRRCLDICPTQAFPAPYQLDARRCISYLTIEHKGHIAAEFRPAMGNRIFGCDDCLAVCPWNKFAAEGREARLAAREAATLPPLAELLLLDDAAFRARFAGSPIKRTGRDRFVRNVLIAAGNSRDFALAGPVAELIADASPLVRAMAAWALARLDPERFRALRAAHAAEERDPDVAAEWRDAA
jgi:epoxyqueuosine reductase